MPPDVLKLNYLDEDLQKTRLLLVGLDGTMRTFACAVCPPGSCEDRDLIAYLSEHAPQYEGLCSDQLHFRCAASVKHARKF